MLASCSAVLNGASHERSLDTKEIKHKAFERSAKRVLLIDHTKFTAHGTYRFEPLSAYDLVCTDAPPPIEYDDGSVKFVY
jgi:DeoR/GlpR family transcriptional regulator of sugar metabolism